MEQIQLLDIEKAIRANFIIDKNNENYLHAIDDHYPHKPNIPPIVFCGVARLKNFSQDDIIKHLMTEKRKFISYAAKFVEAFNECRQFELSKLYHKENTNKLIYRKYEIICNALVIKQANRTFLELSDLV